MHDRFPSFCAVTTGFTHLFLLTSQDPPAVRDPTLYKIPRCTTSHTVQHPGLYEIPPCTRSHAAQDPALYNIARYMRSHAVREPAPYLRISSSAFSGQNASFYLHSKAQERVRAMRLPVDKLVVHLVNK